jgi:hypothetical protein
MRYRKLDDLGDYSFGQGDAQFHVDTAQGVLQAVETRLTLWSGEWFLDTREGTPYATEVLGRGTQATYDQAIKERVLDTPGVTSIDEYTSVLDGRALTVSVAISTIYGTATLQKVFQ